ncbi:MAG: glutathione S-transferase [Comamonadaceae bacterium]|nr:MAG: glutathione S-transferase [Comamonadaceae bacterium]
MLPVLYSFRRCPYAMRARLAIAASGVQVEHREVVLRDKPQALIDASPKATVPVLVLPDGLVVEQSLDIMLWALRQNDPHRWLAPESLSGMLALIAENDGDFKRHLDRYKYPNRYPHEWTSHGDGEKAFMAGHRAEAMSWLLGLQGRLAGPAFLFGDSASLADMAILPFVRQFAHTDAGWFAAQAWPQLHGWLENFERSTLYGDVMQKHLPWKP